eukprot:scaffold105386_cov21-Tisochrysis_lutea.AAC.2
MLIRMHAILCMLIIPSTPPCPILRHLQQLLTPLPFVYMLLAFLEAAGGGQGGQGGQGPGRHQSSTGGSNYRAFAYHPTLLTTDCQL